MASNRKWYPDGRQNQIDFCKRWMSVFVKPAENEGTGGDARKKWQAWGIPQETFTAFATAYAAAVSALEDVILSGLREGPLHKAAVEAFAALEKIARDIKRRYLFCPPLTPADMEELDLKQRARTRTRPPVPRYAPLIRVSNPGKHVIHLSLKDPEVADQNLKAFRVIIRMGILPRDGKIPEKTPFAAYYISKIPVIAEELPIQVGRGRKNEDFILSALESGSTAYISVCYENSRGETGPWSEIIEVIIT